MAVADLNGDGKPDVVVGTAGQPGKQTSSGASLVIALNKGDGNFVTSTLPTLDVGPAAIAISDLNRDGNNDLVYLTSFGTTNPPTLNEVVVALGHGDGTFSPRAGIPVNIASSPAPYGNIGTSGAIAVGDMNGDGIPDIVTNGISILLGDGKGGFPTREDFLNTAGESVILADFDGDGKLDVVIGTGNPLVLNALGFVEGTLTVFLGDGTGSLAAAPIAPSPIPITENPSPLNFPGTVQDASLASGDFNHDGIADLALVTAFQYLTVFLGNASGTLVPIFSYDFSTVDPADSPTSVAAGDFNGDGILDLAVTVARSTIARPVAPARIMVFLGKGDGTFLAPVSSNSPVVSIWSLVTGDFNKDGKADVAAINSSGSLAPDQVVVFLGKGDGTFASAQTYPAGVAAVALAAGDLNQDGAADLAIANQAGISLLLGNADGTLVPGTSMPFPAQSLIAADLKRDGKLDLVADLYGDAGIAVLLGNGDGTFGSAAIYPGGTGLAIAAGDINGDGIPDIVSIDGGLFIGNGDGTFTFQLTNLGDGIFTYQLNNLFATYGPLVAADFNGDGKLDVASGFFTTPSGASPLENGAAVFFNLSPPGALLSIVSAADFSNGPLSPHSIVSAFGKHLALSTAAATAPLLPTTLGSSLVSVEDQTGTVSQAEIYYASPQQVNFVLPAGLEPGTAIVTIKTTDGQSASTEIQIASNPKIFLVDRSGIPAGYVVRVGTDNVQTVEPIFAQQGGHVQEVPIDVSTGAVYLILFGTGFDSPVDTTASGFRSPCPPNTSTQCEHDLSVTYAGPQAQFPGLDQVNILLPSSLAGIGVLNLSFGFETSQQNLYITIK